MASSDSKPRSTGEEPEWPGPRHGWRVEGLPDGEPDAPANPSGGGNLFPRGPRFWVILLGLLLLNWFIYTQFAVSEPEPRVRISSLKDMNVALRLILSPATNVRRFGRRTSSPSSTS